MKDFQIIDFSDHHKIHLDSDFEYLEKTIKLIENWISLDFTSSYDELLDQIRRHPIPILSSQISGLEKFVVYRNTDLTSIFDYRNQIVEIAESRFSYCPNHLVQYISEGRCNYSGQSIFYCSSSPLVALFERINILLQEKKLGKFYIGGSEWYLPSGTRIQPIGDFQKLSKTRCTNGMYHQIINSNKISEKIKSDFLRFFELLGILFSIDGKNAYKVTGEISNYFYSSGVVDGIVYPAVRSIEKIDEDHFEPGFNFAVNPACESKFGRISRLRYFITKLDLQGDENFLELETYREVGFVTKVSGKFIQFSNFNLPGSPS